MPEHGDITGTPSHGDSKTARGNQDGTGHWVRGRHRWAVLVPTEEIEWSGVKVGPARVPNAPDCLSVSPLGTRTESEHGGHPGRPNWRPSQTVKRGECRGRAVEGNKHSMAQHGTVPSATLRGSQDCVWPLGYTEGSGVPGDVSSSSSPVLTKKQGAWSHRLNPTAILPLGPLQREIEARKNLRFQTSSCALDPLLRASCSHRERRGQAIPGGFSTEVEAAAVSVCTQGGAGWASTPLQECSAPSTHSLSDKCDTPPWELWQCPAQPG